MRKIFALVGKSYAAQRQFKAKWNLGRYEKIKDQRIRSSSVTISDANEGEYMPLAAYWRAEGKDESGKKATLFWAKKAMDIMVSGEAARSWKRPPMAWNSDTGRFDYLRRRKTFCDKQTEEWTRVQHEKAVPAEVLPSSSSTDGVGVPADKEQGKGVKRTRNKKASSGGGKKGKGGPSECKGKSKGKSRGRPFRF